jgi:PQQ-dependent catabolism-associated beta-propeller protein
MRSDIDEVNVILSDPERGDGERRIYQASSEARLRRSLRAAQGTLFAALRMTARTVPVLLVVACGKDRPDLGGRSDTIESRAIPSAEPSSELAYVTNEDSQELSVIDTRTDSVVATIPVGTRPRGVRVSQDGGTVFVALSGSPKCPPTMPDEECEKLKADKSKDGIAVVDVASRRATRVLPGGSDPEAFDISRDGSTLFVSNEDAGTASIVDIATGKVRSTVQVGKEPEGVRLQPDGSAVWVTGETDHNVTLLDTKTGSVITQVKVGKRPRDLAFTPDGSRAYVTSEIDGTVWVLDLPARKVAKVISLPKNSKPMGVVVSPDGQRVFVANGRGGTVSAIDPASNTITSTVPVGQRPWGIAITPDGSKLYTANGPSNDVTVLDAKTLKVIKKVPVGKIPWGVAIGPSPRQRE